MKQVTQQQAQGMINNAGAFTDGGEWAIINGGQNLIAIDAIENEEGRVHLVEIYETDGEVMTPDECPPLADMKWIDAWVFEDAHAAVAHYIAKVSESALHRMQNSI